MPTYSDAEDLAQPLDADIRVSGDYPCWHLSLQADGQAVSWCNVVDFEQQVGTQCLSVGGIASVGTHDNYRFRGYSRRLLENALRWMRREGFDASMLYGITGFYPRFGYAEAFPIVTHTMAVRDAEQAAHGRRRCHCEEATSAHIPGMLALFAACNSGRTGVIRRDPRHWTSFSKSFNQGFQARVTVLLDARDALLGYYVSNAAMEQQIVEVGYASHRVFGELLQAITAQVWAARCEEMHFLLPEDHAFVEYCRPYGLRTQSVYRRDGGAMVRLINIPTTLRKLAPLLAPRVSGRGALTIHTNLGAVGLAWAGGECVVNEPKTKGTRVCLPQWRLAQLVYGYLAADSPANDNVITGSRNGRAVLTQLFPAHPHYHYMVDHF